MAALVAMYRQDFGRWAREVDEARAVWDELIAINCSYSFVERIASMPFRNPADPARIAKGLERAGLLASSITRS